MVLERRSFLFLLTSAREGGNTEALARHASTYLPTEAEQRWLRLSDLPLPAFVDIRHSGDGTYPIPTGNEAILLDATLEATDIVIASPLYWYSVSASAKLYLDYWAGWLRVPGADFKAQMKGKTLWAVSTVSSDDVAWADPMIGTLRLSAEYLDMRWGGAVFTKSNRPGDVMKDTDALTKAQTFFRSF